MTFKNIIDQALARVGEIATDIDAQDMSVVKAGINQGYMILSSTVDRKAVVATIAYANPMSLPADVIDIIKAKHSTQGELSPSEYIKEADLMYFLQDLPAGNIVLTYAKFPETLVQDNDTVSIKDGYALSLTAYGAYAFQLYRKKYASAQLLMAEFQSFLQPEIQKPKN